MFTIRLSGGAFRLAECNCITARLLTPRRADRYTLTAPSLCLCCLRIEQPCLPGRCAPLEHRLTVLVSLTASRDGRLVGPVLPPCFSGGLMLARRAATGTLPSVQRFLCTSAFPNSLRGIPAQQVDVSLSPDPSGLSFAHHCRRNRAVDSELAAPLVSRSRAALLKSFCIVTSELRDTSPWGLHGWPGPALSCRGNDGDAGPTNHAAASASGSGFRLRSRHVGNFG